MSSFAGPEISNSGLVLCLDAGNTKSYPGSGTTWTDLSGNGNHATLTATSFQSNALVFDGSTSFGTLGNSGFFTTDNNFRASNGYAWSISVWFKFPVSPATSRVGNASYALCGAAGGIGGGETLTLFIGSGTDSTYGSYVPYYCAVGIFGAKMIISPSSVNTNTWNNVVLTWNGSSGRSYFNSSDRGALTIGAAALQTGYFFGIGQVGSTSHVINSAQLFEGSIANYAIYNRAVTDSEVKQNFNALRGRFGI